jgi:choline-sulfatase
MYQKTKTETNKLEFSRRKMLMTATAGSVATLAGLAARRCEAARRADGPPNVLFLMSDEHSPHALGCDANTLVRTPALDGLAASGLLFTSAYCQDPICVPSRASFVTGKMPSHVNVFGNDGGLTEKTTLATVFREAGYVAEWLGKEHWGGKTGFGDANTAVKEEQKKRCTRAKALQKRIGRLPQDAAVADYPVAEEPDSVTTDHALKFLENHDGKPFFLGVSYVQPHFAFIAQQPAYDLYKDAIDVPRVTPAMLDDLCMISRQEREKYELGSMTDAQIKKARAIYYGMVTYMDGQIGKVLKKLDELGLRENTIILYTADHGELAGEHGLWYKNSFYEASVSVPHIWSFPKRLPRNQRIGAHVMNMDIFPTLCELCGVPAPKDLEGSSLVPLMTGKEDGMDRIAISENYRGGLGGRMIRMHQWKYCWYSEGGDQLYNLDDDPSEEQNLVSTPGADKIIARLRKNAPAGFLEFPTKQKGGAKTEGKKNAGAKETSEVKPWLARLLEESPAADANGDGVLTKEEATAFKAGQKKEGE